MRSRSSAFSTLSAAQVDSASRSHGPDLALQLGAFLERCGELGFELGDFAAERVRCGAAAAGGRDSFAQVALDCARGVEIAAQPLDLVVALGQQPALIAKPRSPAPERAC